MTKEIFDKYYLLFKNAENKKIAEFIGYNKSLKLDIKGDSILGNLMMDSIGNSIKTDISIANFIMFQNEISTGKLSILDFIKLIPLWNHLCTTELIGGEIIVIIKTVQIGEKGFYPTSGIKQTIKINKDKKEVINIQLYINRSSVDTDKNKIYTLSSNNVVLSKDSKEEFSKKGFIEIIKDKYNKNKIKCKENNVYIEIANFLKIKEWLIYPKK